MLKKVLSYLPMMSLAFCLLPAAAFAQTGASSLTNPRAKNVNVSSSVVALPGRLHPGTSTGSHQSQRGRHRQV